MVGYIDTVWGAMLCCRYMRPDRWLTHLLYPPACLLCQMRLSQPAGDSRFASTAAGFDHAPICANCQNAMPSNSAPVCTRCGVQLRGAFDAVMSCSRCRRTPQRFDAARAPWRYAGTAQRAVRQFKYHRRWRLGRWLAQEMATTARRSLPLKDVDLVVPVPLHWLKRRIRGFDPAEELATSVSGALLKPYVSQALRRTRWTKTQTHLHGPARIRNVHHAFTARPAQVAERTVLLIDDVLTSGATASACAQALKQAGARAVFVLTAARTPLE